MNASLGKKITRRAALLFATAGLTGCVGSFDPVTDATSPVAPRVQALVDANRTYPRWENFPTSPRDLPAPVEVAARVNTLRATGGALAGEAARIEWTLGDPVAFEAEVNSRIDASRMAPVTARTAAEVEAYAAALRARAKAPPPIDRH